MHKTRKTNQSKIATFVLSCIEKQQMWQNSFLGHSFRPRMSDEWLSIKGVVASEMLYFQSSRGWTLVMTEGIFSKILRMRSVSNFGVRS